MVTKKGERATRICGDCRHWEIDEDETALGECRRYAPRAAVVSEIDGAIHEAWWPLTWHHEWCSEWATGEDL
jgi:hypothetical protein